MPKNELNPQISIFAKVPAPDATLVTCSEKIVDDMTYERKKESEEGIADDDTKLYPPHKIVPYLTRVP